MKDEWDPQPRMECRLPTEASVAQVPKPCLQSVAQVPKPECRSGGETPYPHQGLFGAEDGIRTRDPHLGKVLELVLLVCSSLVKCVSVHPVSTTSSQIYRCSRAVYYPLTDLFHRDGTAHPGTDDVPCGPVRAQEAECRRRSSGAEATPTRRDAPGAAITHPPHRDLLPAPCGHRGWSIAGEAPALIRSTISEARSATSPGRGSPPRKRVDPFRIVVAISCPKRAFDRALRAIAGSRRRWGTATATSV